MSLSFVYFDIVVVTCNYVSKVPSFIRIRFESGVWASFLVRSSCDSIFESFFGRDFRLSRAIFPFVALHEYYLKIPSFYSNNSCVLVPSFRGEHFSANITNNIFSVVAPLNLATAIAI